MNEKVEDLVEIFARNIGDSPLAFQQETGTTTEDDDYEEKFYKWCNHTDT